MSDGYGLSGVFRNEAGDVVHVQSLEEHSKNVAAYCSRQGEKIDLSVTAHIGGLLHDAGKAKRSFKNYILEPDEEKREAMRGTVVHSRAGALIVERCLKEFDTEHFAASHGLAPKEARQVAQLTAEILQAAIMGHHTGLTDCYKSDGTYVLSYKAHEYEKEDRAAATAFENIMPFNKLKARFTIAVEEMARMNQRIRAVSLRQSGGASPLMGYQPNAGMFFFLRSLLAKWLTATIADAERFDFSNASQFNDELVEEDDWTASQNTWKLALNAAKRHECNGWVKGRRMPNKHLTGRLTALCEVSGGNQRGIYSFVAPGGDWKTLGFIRFALAHAAKENHERLIYVATDELAVIRAANIIRAAVGTRIADTMVAEFHAGTFDDAVDDDGMSIQFRESRERWRKPILITTQRHFMDMLFAQSGTEFRKMQSVTNAIVLFEDIQLLPTKLTSMFVAACEFLHGITNCSVVVGSSTETGLQELPYWKLRFAGDIRGTGEINLDDDDNIQRRIVDLSAEGNLSAEQLAQMVSGGKAKQVLVVLNTSSGAEHVFHALQDMFAGEEISLLTERMCPEHLLSKIEDIESSTRKSSGQHIVVCTPAIAHSRDWLVDMVYRARTGLDDIVGLAHRCVPASTQQILEIKVFNGADERESETVRWKKAGYEAVLAAAEKEQWTGLADPRAGETYIRALTKAASQPQGRLLLYPLRQTSDMQLSDGNTLVDAFGANAVAHKRSLERGHPLRGAFGTVGAEYCYDEAQTTPIIVPYNSDAIKLIQELSDPEINNIKRSDLVRQAQKYTVRVPDVELKLLKELGMIRRLKRRVYICAADWYNRDGNGLPRATKPQENIKTKKGDA